MDLYYNMTRQCRVNEDNCVISGRPVLYLGARPELALHFYTGEPGSDPVPADLSGIAAWRAAVDADWSSATDPMCRTLPEEIDAAAAASGVIKLPLNTCTVRFAEALGNRQSLEACFELRGFDASGAAATVILFNVICHNAVDADGGAALDDVPSDVPTKSWILAVLSGYTAATESINDLTIRVGSAESSLAGATAGIAALADTVDALVPVTAFEVFASETALTTDTTAAEIPECFIPIIFKKAKSDLTAAELASKPVKNNIVADCTHAFELSTTARDGECDVTIDWGDGTTTDLRGTVAVDTVNGPVFYRGQYADGTLLFRIRHTYAAEGVYKIQVFGRQYWRINNSVTGYNSLVCRVFDSDLPIAPNFVNLSSFCNTARRLFHVDNAYNCPGIRHLYDNSSGVFSNCFNLMDVTWFDVTDNCPGGVPKIFYNAQNLTTISYRLPAHFGSGAQGIKSAFGWCKALAADIASLFPEEGFDNGEIAVGELFYKDAALYGTVPADKLWDAPGIVWTDTEKAFEGCSAAIRAQVPVSWGGTAPDSIIKPKLTGLEILHPVSVTGGTVILNAARNAYTVTPEAATAITIDASALGEITGAEFTLIVDMSAGVQTVTFPANFSFVGGTAPVMSRKGYYFIRTTFSGLGEGGFFGEYIGVTTPPKDLTRGIWYYDATGELDDSVYDGQEYVSEATIPGGTFLVNSGAVVGELNTVEDYENPGAAVSRCIIAGTVGVVNANPGVVSVLGGTIGTLYGSDVTITAGKVGSLESPLDYNAAFLLQGGVVDYVSLMWNTSGFSMTGGTVVNLLVEDYRDASVIGGTVVSACEATTGTVLTVGGTATVGTVTLSDQGADWLTGSGLAISGDALVQRVVDAYAIYDDSPVKTGISISGGTVCIAPGLAAKITAGQVALNVTGGTVVYLES